MFVNIQQWSHLTLGFFCFFIVLHYIALYLMTVLKRSSKIDILAFPSLRGNTFSISPLLCLLYIYHRCSFKLRKFLFIPSLVRIFIMNGYWILSNVFFCSKWNVMAFVLYPVNINALGWMIFFFFNVTSISFLG